MNKKDIRKKYGEKRKALAGDMLRDMTTRMAAFFNAIDLDNIKAVLSYSPIAHHNEFNIRLCEKILADRPGIKIAHPRIIQDSNFMEAVVLDQDTHFADNCYAITEPAQGKVLTPESFDLVLVPLLAFDTRGYRVGYGKGFYDRWLAQCRPETVKAGFSFFDPLEAIDDINEFDVPLNLCITPMRVYEF